MNYDTILVTHRGPTAVVALNRPDKLNAMSMMLKAEVVRALHDLDADEHTRTIVLTGSGDKAFTAGATSTSSRVARRWSSGECMITGPCTTRSSEPRSRSSR